MPGSCRRSRLGARSSWGGGVAPTTGCVPLCCPALDTFHGCAADVSTLVIGTIGSVSPSPALVTCEMAPRWVADPPLELGLANTEDEMSPGGAGTYDGMPGLGPAGGAPWGRPGDVWPPSVVGPCLCSSVCIQSSGSSPIPESSLLPASVLMNCCPSISLLATSALSHCCSSSTATGSAGATCSFLVQVAL
jgi:hypothetical protein